MKSVLGLTKFSPISFIDSLRAYVKSKDWRMHVFDRNAKPVKFDNYIFIFLGMADFFSIASELKEHNCIAVVFDCKEKLQELRNIKILDLKPATVLQIKEELRASIKSKDRFKIELVRRNHILEAMDKNKADGFMHIYNTTFYSITNKDIRDVVKQNVVLFLGGYIDNAKFDTALKNKLPKRGKGKIAVENFMQLMKSDQVHNLRSAIKAVRAIRTPLTVEEAAKKFKAIPYDIRYMLAALDKMKEEGKLK